jgi:uncharacterized protein with NRDE domain
VCTVLLRLAPGERWPLALAAVRDEFLERAWDPPARHWPASAPSIVGGRDRTGHGTWLAVRASAQPAVAALLNGVRLPPLPHGARPTRGALPLVALSGRTELTQDDVDGYDGFHLLVADADGAVVWTWDGGSLLRRDLEPGNHVIVNAGVDAPDSALVSHFAPLLGALPSPSWDAWRELLRGAGVPADDPRALIVRRTYGDMVYGSSSASLIGIGQESATFEFTANPADPHWSEVDLT